jgi:hypothetical protein
VPKFIPPPGYPSLNRRHRNAVRRCIVAEEDGTVVVTNYIKPTFRLLRDLGLLKVGRYVNDRRHPTWTVTEAGRELWLTHLRFGS